MDLKDSFRQSRQRLPGILNDGHGPRDTRCSDLLGHLRDDVVAAALRDAGPCLSRSAKPTTAKTRSTGDFGSRG